MHDVLHEWRALDTSQAALRRFGWTVGAVFVGLAALVAWKHAGALTLLARGMGGAGLALVAFGTIRPALLRPVYRVWMLLAVAMGFVMTRVLLTMVFFTVATPIGLVRRALGHDPMRRRRPTGSLWVERPPEDDVRRRMEHTF